MGIAIAAASVSGDPDAAERSLRAALAEADRIGFPGRSLEARLALGELEVRSGRVDAGGKQLATLVKDACAKGLLLIVCNAGALFGGWAGEGIPAPRSARWIGR